MISLKNESNYSLKKVKLKKFGTRNNSEIRKEQYNSQLEIQILKLLDKIESMKNTQTQKKHEIHDLKRIIDE